LKATSENDTRDGDIVIAQVDREWAMKYLRRRGYEGLPRGCQQGVQTDSSAGGTHDRRGGAGGDPEIRMTPPLTIRSFPRGILHIDGDAFFRPVSSHADHDCRAVLALQN